MTLIELQNKLGEQIEALTNPEASNETRKQAAEIAAVISKRK